MGKASRSKSARRDRSLTTPPQLAAEIRPGRRPGSTAFRLEYLAAVLLATAGLVVYLNALRGPFVLDDLAAIPGNSTIRALWPPSNVLSPPARTAVTGRPVVNLSLALNYAIGGLNVGSYHVFNLTVHLVAALVLFGIVRRTLVSPGLRARYRGQATGLALAAALLWVVHPLVTESVDYTIQRTELLMGLFFLLTLYCALRGFESPGRRIWHVAALVAFALGMGSKEVVVVAPVVVLAYDRLFWSTSLRDAVKRHWRLYAGLAMVLVIFVLLIATRFRRTFAGFANRDVTPWEYALTQSGVIVHYLRLAFWPNALSGDYDGWPIARSIGDVLPSLIAVVALVALTLWGLLRRKMLAFLGVFFFLVLAPTSSFRPLPAEVAAERRMYLPLAAVVVLIVLVGHAFLHRLGAPRAAGVGIVAVLAVTLAVVTIQRNDDYRTTLSFWSDVVAKRPDNPRARMWLGDYLHKNGRSADALEHLAAAVRLRPGHGPAHYSLGVALASQGRTDEAIDHYRKALRIDPEYASAHNNLGIALAARGYVEEAIEHYRATIRTDPLHAGAHYNLAIALSQLGRTDEVTGLLEAAVRLKPDFPEARRALAVRGNRALR